MKRLLGVVLGAAALAIGGMATKADALPCCGFATLGALATAGECQTGDKNLDYVSGTIPATTGFTFTALNADLYILSFNYDAASGGIPGPTSFNFNYIISVTD